MLMTSQVLKPNTQNLSSSDSISGIDV